MAIKNRKQQQPIRKATVTPEKGTNWLKKETSRKRTRTPKKSPGEEFQQGAKHAELQSSIQFDANRSFLTIDTATILQSENAKHFNIDSDSSITHNIIATNDPSLFMTTLQDSPPIGFEYPTDQQTFISYKSTPKIDRSLDKIKANKQNPTKQDTPTVVFLNNQSHATRKSTTDQNEKMTAIESERETIRIEKANIITITPSDTNTNSQPEHNSKNTIQHQQQDNSPPDIPTPVHSLRSSTTSQEYKTPQMSPDVDDISDLNSANLRELDETL